LSTPIYINSISSVSALGSTPEEVWRSLNKQESKFQRHNMSSVPVSALTDAQNKALEHLSQEHKRYASLDRTTLMALYVGRHLLKQVQKLPNTCGVYIGSSRGATHTFEKAHESYILKGELPFATSPTTTLGNIASNVAQDLGLEGPAISHSITCSSALHALLNGYAFLKSGMLSDCIVGGAEAPLTGFTIEQMKVLNLYSKHLDDFPCKSLDKHKTENTLVLGEASSLAHLSTTPTKDAVKVAGIGYATEQITHNISLSADAECLQKSMAMALNDASLKTVDVIVMHAPGTVKGDLSELRAVKNTFSEIPAVTTNKWQIGHTFGASGAMSLELASLMIQHNTFIPNPFYTPSANPQTIQNVMVNAVGFGGNAVSVILQKV
jgi:3-oxoacyl-(acyl-carrier-protein) synthase